MIVAHWERGTDPDDGYSRTTSLAFCPHEGQRMWSASERISIVEAFADVAECMHLFGSPAEIASTVRARVRAELGWPMSIGVARTKHLAKVASQVAKPDELVVVDPETELEFLHKLPVALMWGVGPATEARLARIGVTTIGQLAESSPQSVERLRGSADGKLKIVRLCSP
jgi:DNA polymerase-4